ncbi:MAG: recombinase family protein [Nanoarchaeota archaeon]|nr:recombinase family protein [Nanoarchaeota archaeon]
MRCEKCGYELETDEREKFGTALCSICHHLSPNEENPFREYVQEKLDGSLLNTFRKHFHPGEKQKQGMVKKAIRGIAMSRAPFGYLFDKGSLIPAKNSKEIEEIFEEFLNETISLRKLAERHNLSVNGLKKILRNFTYIGKIKFNNQIYEGEHEPLVSTTLFNHVQNKLEKDRIK